MTVRATNDADISSLAGSVSGAGETAVGVAIATNSMGGEVSATMTDSTLAGSGAVVVDALPRNAMGKVQKAELRKAYAGRFAATQNS